MVIVSCKDELATDWAKRRFRASPLPTCSDGRMTAFQLALPALLFVIASGLGKPYHLAALERGFRVGHGCHSWLQRRIEGRSWPTTLVNVANVAILIMADESSPPGEMLNPSLRAPSWPQNKDLGRRPLDTTRTYRRATREPRHRTKLLSSCVISLQDLFLFEPGHAYRPPLRPQPSMGWAWACLGVFLWLETAAQQGKQVVFFRKIAWLRSHNPL